MQIPSSFWDQMLKIPNNQKRKYKKNFKIKHYNVVIIAVLMTNIFWEFTPERLRETSTDFN